MTRFLRIVGLLLLGVWLGAAVFFSAAVAPNLFKVLREADLPNANMLAGAIVTRLVAVINRSGFEISLFLFIVAFFSEGRKIVWRIAEMISLAIMAIMTGVGHWVIAARMTNLRAAMQLPIDQIALSDPRRIAFDNLHRYSVAAMAVAIMAALIAFIVIAINRQTGVGETSQ